MNTQEQGNMTIAKFMGLDPKIYGEGNQKCFNPVYNDRSFGPIRFHDRWDWIMTATEVCWEEGRKLDLDTASLLFDHNFVEFFESSIDKAFEIVVKFIEYLKKQTS